MNGLPAALSLVAVAALFFPWGMVAMMPFALSALADWRPWE